MLDAIKRIFEDIRQGNNLEQIIVAGISIVVAVLGLFGEVDISVTLSTTLAALAVLLFGHMQNRRHLEQLANQRLLGVSEFSVDRSTLPTVDSLIRNASTEVLLIGVALTSVVHSNKELLQQLASRGCKIKLAVWIPPEDDTAKRILIDRLEDVINEPDTESSQKSNIERLKHWHSHLNDAIKRRVEIRGYSNFPTVSIILVDKDTPHGYIHVEPIIFKTPTEKLPSFRLRSQNSPSLFGILNKNYQILWNGARSLVPEKKPSTNKANSPQQSVNTS